MFKLKIASRLTGSKGGHFVFVVTELSIIYWIEIDYYSPVKVSIIIFSVPAPGYLNTSEVFSW